MFGLPRSKKCYSLDCQIRLRIPNRPNYLYTDSSVICDPPELDLDNPKQTTIQNPKLVVEVLSDSTESYHRGRKFELYRENPSG